VVAALAGAAALVGGVAQALVGVVALALVGVVNTAVESGFFNTLKRPIRRLRDLG